MHTYHGHIFHSYYGNLKTKIFLMIERLLAKLATDRIIVISEQQRQEINERFGVGDRRQFRVIPLGLDTSAFAEPAQRRSRFRDELRAGENDILIGIVGRLTEIKNHHLFLEAIAKFKQASDPATNRRVRFVIIGDGQVRTQLETYARELGIGDELVFAGTRHDPEVFYPAFDVVALTSRNEGTPLTLIEAMLNARPVIATTVGGVVDLLGAPISSELAFTICERGIGVRAGDAGAFASGLQRLVGDAQLRQTLGERGRQFVTENYSKERLFEDIAGLYQQLTQRQREAVPVSVRQAC